MSGVTQDVSRQIRRACAGAADFLWPRTCPVEDCGAASDRPGRYLCSHCRETLPWFDDSPVAATAYLDPVPQLLNDFKFGGAAYLAADLGDILLEALTRRGIGRDIDAVVPVPLHPHRQRERGYNQSALLARCVARGLDRRLDTRSFIRARDTEHQSRLPEKDRRHNLDGVFKVTHPEWLRGRTVLLIDDVYTTGSTMTSCTEALRRGGVRKVIPFCVAKALKDDD